MKLKFESRIALFFGLVLGAWALAVVPPIVTYDGPGHYYRSVQIAHGDFRALRFSPADLGDNLPTRYVTFADTLWGSYWGKDDFGSPAAWKQISARAEESKTRTQVSFTNIANYAPVSYVFQSTGMVVSGLMSRSPLLAHQFGCLFNLVGYLLLVVLALELAPRFERGILLIATSPMLFVQATSLSADSINFALPMLVLVWVWHLRCTPRTTPLDVLAPFALGLAVAWLKPTAIAYLFCLVFIPAYHFQTMRRKVALLAGYTIIVVFLWWLWNRPYFDLEIAQWIDRDHPPVALMKQWFLQHPLEFIPVLGRAVASDLWVQWPAFYGHVGGWVRPEIYLFLTPASVIFLVAFLGSGSWRAPVDWTWAGGALLQGALLFSLISLTLWLALGQVGLPFVPWLGGRYLFLVYFALGVAWAESTHNYLARLRPPLFWMGMAVNVAWLTAILGSTTSRVWH